MQQEREKPRKPSPARLGIPVPGIFQGPPGQAVNAAHGPGHGGGPCAGKRKKPQKGRTLGGRSYLVSIPGTAGTRGGSGGAKTPFNGRAIPSCAGPPTPRSLGGGGGGHGRRGAHPIGRRLCPGRAARLGRAQCSLPGPLEEGQSRAPRCTERHTHTPCGGAAIPGLPATVGHHGVGPLIKQRLSGGGRSHPRPVSARAACATLLGPPRGP